MHANVDSVSAPMTSYAEQAKPFSSPVCTCDILQDLHTTQYEKMTHSSMTERTRLFSKPLITNTRINILVLLIRMEQMSQCH